MDNSDHTSPHLRLEFDLDGLKIGQNAVHFFVADFELESETRHPRRFEIENSSKGQHIHLLVDDQPYMARYNNSANIDLTIGEHTIVAFLSRSYHESIKSDHAFIWKNLLVNNDGVTEVETQFPQMIYSRPKGDYYLENPAIDPVLLDFYLKDTDLNDGNFIIAQINGLMFKIDSWAPYYITGLGVGTHEVHLKLVDSKGKLIEGPTNDSGIRKITINKQQK